MITYTFLITSLIIVLIPGTGVIYTISKGISEGKKASTLASIGCTLGIVPHLFVSICLSSILLNLNNKVFFFFKIIGGTYLCYLGITMILSKSKFDFSVKETAQNKINIITRGIFINLLNPKLTLFFFSFLPQYISSSSTNYIKDSFSLGIIFMIITLIIFILYGILGNLIKSFLIKSDKGIKNIMIAFGIIFIVFALNLTFGSL